MTMSKKLKNIELVFENIEVLRLPIRVVEVVDIKGIFRQLRKNMGVNDVDEYIHCEKAALLLDSTANDNKFWVTDYYRDAPMSPFDRIRKYNDITCVTLYYADGKRENIYVPWKGSDEINDLQKVSYDNESGELIIKIEKSCKEEEKE